jgi:hypothetical protein
MFCADYDPRTSKKRGRRLGFTDLFPLLPVHNGPNSTLPLALYLQLRSIMLLILRSVLWQPVCATINARSWVVLQLVL